MDKHISLIGSLWGKQGNKLNNNNNNNNNQVLTYKSLETSRETNWKLTSFWETSLGQSTEVSLYMRLFPMRETQETLVTPLNYSLYLALKKMVSKFPKGVGNQETSPLSSIYACFLSSENMQKGKPILPDQNREGVKS